MSVEGHDCGYTSDISPPRPKEDIMPLKEEGDPRSHKKLATVFVR